MKIDLESKLIFSAHLYILFTKKSTFAVPFQKKFATDSTDIFVCISILTLLLRRKKLRTNMVPTRAKKTTKTSFIQTFKPRWKKFVENPLEHFELKSLLPPKPVLFYMYKKVVWKKNERQGTQEVRKRYERMQKNWIQKWAIWTITTYDTSNGSVMKMRTNRSQR